MVERDAYTVDVGGSKPSARTIFKVMYQVRYASLSPNASRRTPVSCSWFGRSFGAVGAPAGWSHSVADTMTGIILFGYHGLGFREGPVRLVKDGRWLRRRLFLDVLGHLSTDP